MLPFGYNAIFHAKYQEATLKHMKLTHFGTGSLTTFAFTSPDKLCTLPANIATDSNPNTASIRSLILRIKARGTNVPLFLALNAATKAQDMGGFVITYSKQYEAEAVEKIENIAAYFLHHYGDASLERFTQEACDQADLTRWDSENDQPITLAEQDLEEVIEEEIAWIENLGDVTFGNKPEAAVFLERPKPASALRRTKVRPTNADDDTVGTFFPGQTVHITDEDSDVLTTNTGISDPVPIRISNPVSTRIANDESRATHPFSEASMAEPSSESSAGGV
jgi:hypothetical protein